jgi:hypothetical protein
VVVELYLSSLSRRIPFPRNGASMGGSLACFFLDASDRLRVCLIDEFLTK